MVVSNASMHLQSVTAVVTFTWAKSTSVHCNRCTKPC